MVERRSLGALSEGENVITLFSTSRPSAGIYLYRLLVADPDTGVQRASLTGKAVLLK
jgi:hypothetical protein